MFSPRCATTANPVVMTSYVSGWTNRSQKHRVLGAVSPDYAQARATAELQRGTEPIVEEAACLSACEKTLSARSGDLATRDTRHQTAVATGTRSRLQDRVYKCMVKRVAIVKLTNK
ncbi:hypothetical protein PHMEG_00010058 [Phytophthora megakarya]|uniref:Uncharacterized protein n=1 Tax=Phytophthora megakarya TaxID=4795 RepID=A0A225WEZ1_9STRA|nr:hypothetical protein PHMEG_00010058 [Phytophthora megakarya]